MTRGNGSDGAEPSSAPVLIALGSNVGDPLSNLRRAVKALKQQLDVTATSHVYETEPMYVEDQPAFLNAAVAAQTDLGPRSLLKLLKRIEQEQGRQKRARYGPREIDLDLIAYGSLAYTFFEGEALLNLPHPRAPERRFVMMPLNDVAPSFLLTGLGVVGDLLRQTDAQASAVVRVEDAQL